MDHMLMGNSEATAFMPTTNGNIVTISEFISQLDEAAATRLQRMNQRLRQLEMQMELLETEICKTSSYEDPYNNFQLPQFPFPPSLVNGFQA